MRAWSVETGPSAASVTPWQSRGSDQGLFEYPAPAQAIFSELMPGFSRQAVGILHFDPVEYPITKEELAGFQKAAMQGGVSFCFLSTWEGGMKTRIC